MAEAGTCERRYIGDVVPDDKTASGGRLRTPYCTRPVAVDARQIAPHPLGGCVSFRPLPPPPPWRERNEEEGDEDGRLARRPAARGGSGRAQDGDHRDGSPVRGRGRAGGGDVLLQHAAERSGGDGRLAERSRRRGCGHGRDRGLLAGALRGPGGGRDRGDPGARTSGEAVEGTQDRCGRQRVAGLRVPVRALHAFPCAASAVPGSCAP